MFELNPFLNRYVLLGCGSAALLAGAFAAGRYTAHEKVREVTVEKTVTHVDEKAQEQIRELTEQLEQVKRSTHRESVVYVRKDGTREKHEIVDTRVETDTETEHQAQTERVVTRDIVKQVEVVHTVTRALPNWHVGALVEGWPGVEGAPLSAGVTVSRRVLGPLFLGVNATLPIHRTELRPLVGMSLSLEF